MKSAIVLLASISLQNQIRRIAYDLNTGHGVPFYASLLPSHVSLKQPFAFENMDVLENYVDGLAASIPPFEIELNGLYYSDWGKWGILGLNVVESSRLRGLHNRLNAELSRLFLDTRAPFDGDEYRFHMTIEMSQAGASGLKAYYTALPDPSFSFRFIARELAVFFYPGTAESGGSFIPYRVCPLAGKA